jgi:hypothetical protein
LVDAPWLFTLVSRLGFFIGIAKFFRIMASGLEQRTGRCTLIIHPGLTTGVFYWNF